MNLSDSKKKLALAGVICGLVAACLAFLGNPANMAFCIACFIRTNHNDHSQNKTDHRRRTSRRTVFLRPYRDNKRPKHQTDDALKKGFSLGRAHAVNKVGGAMLPAIMVGILILALCSSVLKASETGPGSMHAPLIAFIAVPLAAIPSVWHSAAPTNIPITVTAESDDPCPARIN